MTIRKTWGRLAIGLCALWSLGGMQAAEAQQGAAAGRVIDEAGNPLPGVNVVLLETTYGAASAADGTWRIGAAPAGAYRIQASIVGFATEVQPIDIAAGQTTHIDFVLESVAVASREIVVTTTRRTEIASDIAASVSVLTAEDLVTRNVLALDDALQYVPGVQLTGNEVNVRGSSGFSYNTGTRVLLLVDGMPMLSPDAERIPFDLIPVHQIEQIEVLKGPGSALYGGGALGGVIHIVTKTYPEPGPKRTWKYTEGRTSRRATIYGGGNGKHPRIRGPSAASPSTMRVPSAQIRACGRTLPIGTTRAS